MYGPATAIMVFLMCLATFILGVVTGQLMAA